MGRSEVLGVAGDDGEEFLEAVLRESDALFALARRLTGSRAQADPALVHASEHSTAGLAAPTVTVRPSTAAGRSSPEYSRTRPRLPGETVERLERDVAVRRFRRSPLATLP